jgi:S-(hydroxymethyl)glutathione dehydrogenase/alcohol dehydrogenase
VLIKVHACGVCHTDLHVMKAEVAFPTPAVMGHEVSGTVVALGPGVKGPAVGTRVVSAFVMPCGFCPACGAGRDDLCDNFFGMNRLKGRSSTARRACAAPTARPVAMYSMAGMAEYSVVPATDVFPAAGQPAARGIGRARLRRVHRLRRHPERRDCAAASASRSWRPAASGMTIVQIAKAFGASQIIAVDVRDDKLEAARSSAPPTS